MDSRGTQVIYLCHSCVQAGRQPWATASDSQGSEAMTKVRGLPNQGNPVKRPRKKGGFGLLHYHHPDLTE